MHLTHCPICGLPFSEPVDSEVLKRSYWICDCCGCEYGFDDEPWYRQQWLDEGAPWFDPSERPAGWNLEEQLRHSMSEWNVHQKPPKSSTTHEPF